MADFAGICVRGRGGNGNGDCYRCDPHPKVYYGQVHLWMVHFGVHPPPRGSPRYTKKLQAVTCVPSQNICSTLCSALFFDKDTTTIRLFCVFFSGAPPKRFPNCFISLHFSPPKSHAPQRYSEIYILAWTQLPHFESHVT